MLGAPPAFGGTVASVGEREKRASVAVAFPEEDQGADTAGDDEDSKHNQKGETHDGVRWLQRLWKKIAMSPHSASTRMRAKTMKRFRATRFS